MYNLCALGELLIDFVCRGKSENGREIYECNPGGAPANVLTACVKLGGSGAFIGKVGNDKFGHYLKEVLDDNMIASDGLAFSQEFNTTLAFVHLNEKGDRSFSFYRNHGADIMLTIEDLNLELIDKAKIFHFGSLSMTHEPSKSATIKALEYAKERGKIISFDPNLRPALWKNMNEAKEAMLKGITFTDILKVSEEELGFLTGNSDLAYGASFFAQAGVKITVVTLGPRGCFFSYKNGSGYIETYDTKIVDTTGAGDAFLGGLLYCISNSKKKIEEIELDDLKNMLSFSNAVAAICASKFGAIPSMPSLEEVQSCIENVQLLKY